MPKVVGSTHTQGEGRENQRGESRLFWPALWTFIEFEHWLLRQCTVVLLGKADNSVPELAQTLGLDLVVV